MRQGTNPTTEKNFFLLYAKEQGTTSTIEQNFCLLQAIFSGFHPDYGKLASEILAKDKQHLAKDFLCAPQYEALKILGSDAAEEALTVYLDRHVDTLRLCQEKGYSNPLSIARQFKTEEQFKVWQLLGAKEEDIATIANAFLLPDAVKRLITEEVERPLAVALSMSLSQAYLYADGAISLKDVFQFKNDHQATAWQDLFQSQDARLSDALLFDTEEKLDTLQCMQACHNHCDVSKLPEGYDHTDDCSMWDYVENMPCDYAQVWC